MRGRRFPHRFGRVAGVAIIAAAVAATGVACSGAGNDEGASEVSADLSAQQGVDYAWSRPSSPQALRAAGYTFVSRYLSWDTSGKNLTASEAQSLFAAGIDVVANWEYGAMDALQGSSTGASDAQQAQALAAGCGMPPDRPIYFSVDFDATPQQQAAIDSYFDGVASVIGVARAGAYGDYYVIQRLFDNGKIKWGWQTYAWSGGQWDARAQLQQIQNGVTVAGASCDIDQAAAADFGQWGPGAPTASPPQPAPPPDAAAPDWGAQYVSQSFPLASTALQMVPGQTIASTIELKNIGGKAWDSNTHLATTQPRDRTSAFADTTWLKPNRPAAVIGTVTPGGTYKFQFNLHAPRTPGTYFEYFGVAEDGTAWFSDPGQGGPADDSLEAQLQVVVSFALDGGGSSGGGEGGSGSPAGSTFGGSDAGQSDGGAEASTGGFGSSSGADGGVPVSAGGPGSPSGGAGSVGCGCGVAPSGGAPWTIAAGAFFSVLFLRRRARWRD